MSERKTKIIATLGPAVASAERVSELVGAGMDVARLNFSHGTHDDHRLLFDWVHRAAHEHGRAVAVLQDIQGPKIRVGHFPGGEVTLEKGTEVLLRSGEGTAASGEVYCEHLDRVEDLRPGSRIALADGLILLEVTGVTGQGAKARVLVGGLLSDRKGAAFPGASLDLPAITEKDGEDLAFGAELGVDLIAASFVASAEDVREVRRLSGGLPVIAKIERGVAYRQLDGILQEASGAMVARGDLGVELSIESLPRIQKEIIARTNAAGRISITATEMLESMTNSPRPTRAEATDVANAVLDGTDAVMLSGETAAGRYPVRAVEVMDAICREAEKGRNFYAGPTGVDDHHHVAFLSNEAPYPSAIAQAAVEVAGNLGIETIVGFTESGSTARLISKYRPDARIMAFTAEPRTYRQMALYWGVDPRRMDRRDDTDEMIAGAEALLLAEGVVRSGEGVVMVAGIPPNQGATTNLLKIHEVGASGGGLKSRAQ